MNAAAAAVRTVRMLHLIFLIAIPMYAAAGEIVGQRAVMPEKILRGAFFALTVMNLGVAQLFGRKMVTSAEEALARDGSDAAALGRWRQGQLITFVLCESVALFGLAFRILGGDSLEAAPLYVVAFVLMLLWTPRAEFARQM